MIHESRHQSMIYEGPPSKQLPTLSAILKTKLDEGYRCLYLNSPTMVTGIGSTLAAMGLDVTYEVENVRLILSAEPVSPSDNFNSRALLATLETALDQSLQDGYKGLFVTGDMTWEFGPAKDFSKLLEYECKLDALFRKRGQLCGICQYHRDTLPQDALRQGILTHPSIVISKTLTRVNPYYIKSAEAGSLNTTTWDLDEMIADLCGRQSQ